MSKGFEGEASGEASVIEDFLELGGRGAGLLRSQVSLPASIDGVHEWVWRVLY